MVEGKQMLPICLEFRALVPGRWKRTDFHPSDQTILNSETMPTGSSASTVPKLKGILFELEHVIGRTRESLKAYGLEDRCSLIEGNFFESLPSGADTYLFRHIIHDWSDEQSVLILKNCRKVIRDHGRLLIIEAVVPTGNEPSLAKDFDMVMLVLPGGIERTEEEYRVLLEEAGFQLSSVTPTRSAVSIVEGKPI
jgi:hypothetical protein